MKKLLLLFTLLASTAQAQLYFPGSTWDSLSPASLNWCPPEIAALDSFLIEANSKSCIILKDGKIVHEAYYGTYTQDSVWYWASAGKTLMAFLIGKAQEEGLLNINDSVSHYLGAGWTSMPAPKEGLIRVEDQLQMTTGLDYLVPNWDCTIDTCLQYRTDAGNQWFYHNAPYLLLKDVLENAAATGINRYTQNTLAGSIGFRGLWLDNLYFSNARQMARFGLLLLAEGEWNGTKVLNDSLYFQAMINSSQSLNPAYGYLTWLNGKNSFIQPGLAASFNGPIIPSAPSDLYMAAGKNDQRIYVVPSQGLVVVRQGNAADSSLLALSGFDEDLWQHINALNCTGVSLPEESPSAPELYPNPAKDWLMIPPKKELKALYNVQGQELDFSREGDKLYFKSSYRGLILVRFKDGSSQLIYRQ